MRARITTDPGGDSSLVRVAALGGRELFADLTEARSTEVAPGVTVHLWGDLFYEITDGGVRMLRGASGEVACGLFAGDLAAAVSRVEGTYVGLRCDAAAGTAELFSDRYAREDLFTCTDGGFHAADSLEFIFKRVRPAYDQKMIAHLFTVYGWYTPKGATIYSNVGQLRVGEVLMLTADAVSSRAVPFEPARTEDLGEAGLEAYYEALRDSVRARAADGKTWVSTSSGWDSSMCTAMLVSELGTENVGMMAGSMRYSPQTDVINKFEMDKIAAIGEFFGIEPEVVELDFVSPQAADTWEGLAPFFRGKHMYSFSTYNFAKLSEALLARSGGPQVFFNGETSDSFHNFGFSQFATFFHTVKSFTEYGDKMNSYLYGPTFFAKVLDGSYPRDRVLQIFEKMYGLELRAPEGDALDVAEAYLYPLWYGGPRVPFAKTWANPALHAEGQQALYRYPFREYAPEALPVLTPETLYASYIHLYHSLHSQGSTVNVQKHAATMSGHAWRSPFNDYRVIDVLSRAPESWGRGLDFNHTKHPLKWVAANKLRFPYELLETGPHSYLYDVVEGFSLFAEIVYRSGVTPMFRETLAARPYRELIDGSYIDLEYLDRLVDDFLAGREADGADFNNLVTLITLCVTGWYS